MAGTHIDWEQNGPLKPAVLSGGRQYAGRLDAAGMHFGIAVSRFNEKLTQALLDQCCSAIQRCGAHEDAVTVVTVPGAYEVPVALARLAGVGGYHALIGLGCVVEGETPHADVINQSVGSALQQIALQYRLPVINEVVGTRSLEQAEARCLSGEDSRGWYAGLAAVEMAHLFHGMPS